jgi:pimeloyl-ACP methyl ester carboxylesterase
MTRPDTRPEDRWAQLGGRRLRNWDEGEGAPTVVVEGGLGTTVADWARLLPGLAGLSRTICYDRAGLGDSDPDPAPRTAGRMVDDLEVLLAQAGAQPPYVLLGHSWGGLVMRLFAHRHPQDVGSLVLLDPTHEDTVTSWAPRMNAVTYAVLDLLARASLLPLLLKRSSSLRGYGPAEKAYVLGTARSAAATARREVAGMAESIRELARAQRQALPCPAHVLSAGGMRARKGALARAYDRLHSLHRDLAGAHPDGRHALVMGAGHYVHLDRPDLVLDTVAAAVGCG